MATIEENEELDGLAISGKWWRVLRRATMSLLWGMAGFAALVIVGYQVENWRGKRAWRACQREVERKGSSLDYRKFVPPPVPVELNALKAPALAGWFNSNDQSEVLRHFGTDTVFSHPEHGGAVLAEISVVRLDVEPAADTCDLMLDYRHPFVFLSPESSGESSGTDTKIPLIVMDEVPLVDAIRNLARQAELNYILDPSVTSSYGLDAALSRQPSITVRWEYVTARTALLALLSNYNLELIEDPKTRIGRITWKSSNYPNPRNIQVDCDAQRELGGLLARSCPREPDRTAVDQLQAATGEFTLFRETSENSAQYSPVPGRIILRMAFMPGEQDLQELLQITCHKTFPNAHRLRVAGSGRNTFRVYLSPPPFCRAEDYLALTDRFAPDFDQIREPLKRPMARMECDYLIDMKARLPSFAPIRTVAQLLAQRAQAYLLMDRPAEALREIRLALDLCALLENRPSGTPVMLVNAMIRVALTGLCVDTIAQGFQLGTWRESELRELQDMLSAIHLAPVLAGALSFERVLICHHLETCSAEQYFEMLSLFGRPPLSRWAKLKMPEWWLFAVAPRGWVYQNMIHVARVFSPQVEGYDAETDFMNPRLLDQSEDELQTDGSILHPYILIAAPKFVRAWETTARTQARINQALVACALERHYLAHKRYPEKLETLVPEFTAKLPRDIQTGEPPRYCFKATGDYLLYSIGWDLVDHGGEICRSTTSAARDAAEWIWPAEGQRCGRSAR